MILHFLLYRSWDHDDVQDRDEHGHLIYVCRQCGRQMQILASPIVRTGPLASPRPVQGTPLGKARQVERSIRVLTPRRSMPSAR